MSDVKNLHEKWLIIDEKIISLSVKSQRYKHEFLIENGWTIESPYLSSYYTKDDYATLDLKKAITHQELQHGTYD